MCILTARISSFQSMLSEKALDIQIKNQLYRQHRLPAAPRASLADCRPVRKIWIKALFNSGSNAVSTTRLAMRSATVGIT